MAGFFSALKKIKDDAEVSKLKKNDWKKFGIDIVSNLIWTLITGFVACNFVYISQSNLDAFFPTDCQSAPYNGNYNNKVEAIDYFSPNKFTFPYNLGPCGDCDGIAYDIKNWFITSIRFSYMNGRKLMKGLMSVMKEVQKATSGNSGSGQPGQTFPFIMSFFLVPLFIYGSFFGGFFLTTLGQFYDGKNIFSRFLQGLLAMFFFGLGPTIAGGVGFIQSLQTAITFGILPFFQNRSKLMGVIGRSKMLLVALFGFLILLNAGKNLQELPQWPMWLVYFIIVLIPTLFSKGKAVIGSKSSN